MLKFKYDKRLEKYKKQFIGQFIKVPKWENYPYTIGKQIKSHGKIILVEYVMGPYGRISRECWIHNTEKCKLTYDIHGLTEDFEACTLSDICLDFGDFELVG